MSLFPPRLLAAAALLALLPGVSHAALYVTVVEGLGGTPAYAERFQAQRESIEQASHSLTPPEQLYSFHGETATREALLAHFEELAASMSAEDRALIYLIGHGSYDDIDYRFNIPGPDLTTADLRDILVSLPGENHVLVNTSSTSGALLDPLEDEGRVLITATRSGGERNATEFGAFLAEALVSEEADLDKNGGISAQEAFDYAKRRVEDHFESAGQLATEHPQLRGDNAGRLVLARLDDELTQSDDPEIAALLEQRREVEQALEDLQLNRDDYGDADYTRRLRELVLESATINERLAELGGETADE